MAFIALRKDTQERIDITRIEKPYLELKSGDCVCQLCGEPLIVRCGMIRQAHFAHYSACVSDYRYHPESPEHMAGKEYVADLITQMLINMGIENPKVDYEVRIPEAKRVADVLVTFPMGWRIACEIQLASITIADLEERTNDYARAGIDTIWWLGKQADTDQNRYWCATNLVRCYRIYFEYHTIGKIVSGLS
ncbi:MAG TPA: competence protein CoiA family protein [Anaerolineaceae bacterium]|nr:competence protein CoiA family protein [Anaerolineaceae bacterium]